MSSHQGDFDLRGVPPLCADDRVVWQARPAWIPFAQQVLHVRWIAAYIAVLLGWCILAGAQSGGLASAADAAWRFGGLALVALAMLMGLAWGLARSTTYSLTRTHLVIEYGLALSKTVTIPYDRIVAADYRLHGSNVGDIVLKLGSGRGVPYLLMWPHVRPWKMRRAEPMLRTVPHAAKAAQMLSRVLAASADMAPLPIDLTDMRPARAGAAAAAA